MIDISKIREQEEMLRSQLVQSDSYKYSHPEQLPPGTEYVDSYFESRGGRFGYTLFAGLQMIVLQDFFNPITHKQVDFFKDFITIHGEPYPEEALRYIVDEYGGYLPLEIKAVKEGTVVPAHNVLYTVRNTDKNLPWLTQFAETKLVRSWYPITVATTAHACKKVIWGWLQESCMDPEGEIDFKLHDFGARGASSGQSVQRGSAAHLTSFMGSDSLEGILAANIYYNSPMSAFSIPAGEHSTYTSWGKDNEIDAYSNMIDKFSKPDAMYAMVSDSYDLENAIKMFTGPLKDKIIHGGGRLVVRPDSGDPTEIVTNVVKALDKGFGSVMNAKGYRVLHPSVRVIQGDGITVESLPHILEKLVNEGYSAENVTFGMGGGLLQQCNRDTHKFAQKASSVTVLGKDRDVFKDPVTDPGKRSKAGKQVLTKNFSGEFQTVREELLEGENLLETVYKNGELKRFQTLDEIRALANLN